MNIKILGSGCANCHKLEENARKAVKELNIEATIEPVTDFKKIMSYGVMSTPALVINEKVMASGKILSPSDVKEIIQKVTGSK